MLICAFRSVDKPIPILLQRVYYTCMKKKMYKHYCCFRRYTDRTCARASTVPSTSSSSSSLSSMRAIYIIYYHITHIFPRYNIVAGS